MFINVLFGQHSDFIVNPWCGFKNFMVYVAKGIHVDLDGDMFSDGSKLDFVDEYGNVANVHGVKDNMENMLDFFTPRVTYIPAIVLVNPENGFIKKITPLLSEWDKRYPGMKKRLKQQTGDPKRYGNSPADHGRNSSHSGMKAKRMKDSLSVHRKGSVLSNTNVSKLSLSPDKPSRKKSSSKMAAKGKRKS